MKKNKYVVLISLLTFTACQGENASMEVAQTEIGSSQEAIEITNDYFSNKNYKNRQSVAIRDLNGTLRAYEVTIYDSSGKALEYTNVSVKNAVIENGGEGSLSKIILDTYHDDWSVLIKKNDIRILSHNLVGTELGAMGVAIKTDKPLSENVKNYFSEYSRVAYKINDYYILSFFPPTKVNFDSLLKSD